MAVREARSRFVGRAAELAALETAVADAAAGRAAAVLVAGEAGVGKSRLVGELAHEQQGGPARVLVGHCVEIADGELPYAPVVGALRALSTDLGPEELDALIGPAGPVLARLLPGLAPNAGDAPAGEIEQAQLFELLLGFLDRVGAVRPLALVIEDLHWADASTRDLVSFLVRNMSRERLALVATYRSDDLHRRHPLRPLLAELERDPRVRRVTLAPFSRAEFADHVAAIAGELPESRVFEEIYERSEGNAFLTEELLAASSGPGDLPDSVRDAMLVRLERLSEPAQQVVRVAAATGRRVDHRLLTAVAGVDEQALFGALREAVAAQVLVPDQSDRSYEFRHALLRETAYDDLLPGERESLHLSLARALDEQPDLGGDRSSVAAALAYHWFAAYEFELALPASVTAGREAVMVAAYAEAQRHFERALELFGRVAAERRGDLDEIDLLRLASDAAHRSGSHDRASALIRRALDLLDHDAEPARAAVLMAGLADALFEGGNTDEAVTVATRAGALVPGEVSAEGAQVLSAQARIYMATDHPAEARTSAEQAIAVAREVGERSVEAGALATLTATLAEIGRYDEAIERGVEARDIALDLGNEVLVTARVYINASEALDQAGRIEDAIALTLEGVGHARRTGMLRVHGAFLMAEAAGRMLRLGRADDAQRMAGEALMLAPIGVAARFVHDVLALLGLHRGDLEAVRAHSGRSVSDEIHGSQWTGPAAVIEAELLLAEGDAPAALGVVERAVAEFGGPESFFYTAPLRAVGARAAADIAESSRDLRDDDVAATAAAAGRALADGLDQRFAMLEPATPAPEALTYRRQLEAELTRADGRPDPAQWAEVTTHSEQLGLRPVAAYCAWRQGEALVAAGDRAGAEAALRTAYAHASATGAQPLVDEIEALGRRSRIAVGGSEATASADGDGATATAAERLGLTARELDVLGLVVEGQTNRQIGEHLFISEKTASVHVSRILAKLDVANRGEAAAIARRLGLTA